MPTTDDFSSNEAQWFKIDLFTDAACFKVPVTDLEWFTYPLPPVSTCLGLIFNSLGIANRVEFKKLAKSLRVTKVAVSGNYDGTYIDYVWLRNLNVDGRSHFRYQLKGGQIEHPGVQAPTKVHLLHNFRGRIYVEVRSNEKIACNNFEKFVHHPFLGRCEDILTGFEIEELAPGVVKNLKASESYEFFLCVDPNFAFWIPEEIWIPEENNTIKLKHLYFKKFEIPILYSLDELTRSFITCGAYFGTGSLVELWRMLVKSGVNSIPYDSQSMLPIFWFDTSFLYKEERLS